MPISPIWAFGAILLWQLLARIPLAIAPETLWPEALSLGFIGAAFVVNWIDARYFPSELARSIFPRRRIWLLYGLVAGVGFAILGSELGNIGEAIANHPVPLEQPTPKHTNPLTNALLGSVVYPICFIFVLVGVSQRALLSWTAPWTTICMVAIIGTFGGPVSRMAQLALVCGLPAWLYVRSGSVALAAIAYLPTTALPMRAFCVRAATFPSKENTPETRP